MAGLVKRGGTVLATLAVAGLAAGLVALGAQGIARGAAPPDASRLTAAAPVPVQVVAVQPEPGHGITRRFAGQIEPPRETALAFEIGGRLTAVLADEGDVLPAGAALALLDTAALDPEAAALRAEGAALAAQAELARLTLGRAAALADLGHRAEAARDEARLTLARIEAQAAAVAARLDGVAVRRDKSRLAAPFAARVGARLADPGQTLAAGQPVLTLFEDRPPRLRAGLPPDLAATLSPGMAVRVVLGGGRVLDGRVAALRPDLDPATRTRAVLIDLPAVDLPPALGDTATVELDQQVAEPGFWLPLSALREGARGAWTVLVVENGAVRPAAVEVIHAEGTRVFLRGALVRGTPVVAQAPDRVVPGQSVTAVQP